MLKDDNVPDSPGDDNLTFVDEKTHSDNVADNCWKIIIADDEQEVHAVTELVFENLTFEGKYLHCLHTYSGEETKDVIKSNPDTALILLDVVMETDQSGLEVVKYIRDEIDNESVRIILRTGQPGQAPERNVIVDYDINDYKEKTDLSSQKLFTTVIAALRSYKDIIALASLNSELEAKVRERTAKLHAANERLRQTLDKIKEDEEAGKKTQSRLLPNETKSFGSYEFSRFFIPSLYLSGDFLDYFEIDESRVGFYLADVSGHGASSAFVTMLIKSVIDGFVEKYREGRDLSILEPATLMARLNSFLLKEDLGKFATIFFGVLNVDSNELTYTNSGIFPYPMIFDADEGSIRKLDEKGMPVGLFDFAEYNQYSTVLPEKGTVTFFSDGILEVMEEPNVNEKVAVLSRMCASMDNDVEKIVSDFRLTLTEDLPDDITGVMIKKRGRK